MVTQDLFQIFFIPHFQFIVRSCLFYLKSCSILSVYFCLMFNTSVQSLLLNSWQWIWFLPPTIARIWADSNQVIFKNCHHGGLLPCLFFFFFLIHYFCNLHHSSQQRRIVNPLSTGRDRTHNLTTSWFQVGFVNYCATTGTPFLFLNARNHFTFLVHISATFSFLDVCVFVYTGMIICTIFNKRRCSLSAAFLF